MAPAQDSVTPVGGGEFVVKLKDVLENKKQVKEIPRLQRYVNRPSLEGIFRKQETKAQRGINMNAAHLRYGYTLKEIADYLRIRYTAVGEAIAKAPISKK